MSDTLFEMHGETEIAKVQPDPGRLAKLLVEYAEGKDRQREVAMELWSYPESPLFNDLMFALQAAERHGEWKAKRF